VTQAQIEEGFSNNYGGINHNSEQKQDNEGNSSNEYGLINNYLRSVYVTKEEQRRLLKEKEQYLMNEEKKKQ
jgi:hypothetical protein